jgi:4-amino-4-deoxy-L-arabinose transferase-like glycosyltransferase
MFTASAHFANPDALLDTLTLLTLFLFWQSFSRNDHRWIIPASMCMGLAVLTKGPVGLLLPVGVIGIFLLCSRRLNLLVNSRVFLGAFVFCLVAVPWYAWIAAETRGEFLRGFFLTHNVGRFLSPMENHRGPIYYYLIALGLGFAPWSPFFPAAIWYGLKKSKIEDRGSKIAEAGMTANSRSTILDPQSSILFLNCWIAVYLLFFSLAGTKLPNYILPVYPAVAILTARFFDIWLRKLIRPPAWIIHVSFGGLALVGFAVAVGLFLAGGIVDLPVLRGRKLPGIEIWAGMAVVPILGATLAWWLAVRNRHREMVACLLITAVLFIGPFAAWGSIQVDAFKAPRPLVLDGHACQTGRDIRVGCYQFYQPSLVFYCRREVKVFEEEDQVLEFLQSPWQVYLFVPAKPWQTLAAKVQGSHRVLATHRDLYKGYEVVVVTNK